MPFQPVEDALEAVINGHIGSIPFVNVLGFRLTDPLTEELATITGDFIRDSWSDNLNPAITTDFSVSDITITDLRTETGPQFVYTDTEAMDGEATEDPLPFQTAGLITWNTATRGRSFRGRTYLGGFTEGGSDGRSVSSSTQSQMQGFADALLVPGVFGVISRFHGTDPETGAPIPREVGILTIARSAVVHPNWRTQRRRALASG